MENKTITFEHLSIDQLREMYTATFGTYPRKSDTHYNNREHYIGLFEREIKFGRPVKKYEGNYIVNF